jgi:hypothetical protein
MAKNLKLLGCVAGMVAMALAVPQAAFASQPSTAPYAEAPGAGGGTQTWMSLQISGAESDMSPYTLPGDVASRIYVRWSESYSHPIPEYFKSQRYVNSGGSGGTGGGN